MFKHKRLRLVLGISLVSIFLVVVFLRQNYVFPIVMYHSVALEVAPGNRLIVSAKTFEKQMRFLKDNKYNVISLEEAAELIKNKKNIPAKSLVLTFDDGYRDNYLYAFPILKKYNFPATIFIIFNQVEKLDRLSWSQIKKMQDSGLITFGSHTISHPSLEHLKPEAGLDREIGDSKKLLEESLGKPVHTFSYPMGRFSPRVEEIVKAYGYKVGVVTNPGKKHPNNDVLALKRLRISENAGNLFVFWIETSGFYNFIRENRHK